MWSADRSARPSTRTRGVAAVLLACLSFDFGCSTKRCSGPAITCPGQAARCDSVPGCASVAACQFSFTAVDSVCTKQDTQKSCEGTTGSACVWTASGRCTTACSSITDPQACHDFSFVDPPYPDKTFPCVWSTCSGIPVVQFCDQYSTDACPADLGCTLKDQAPVGS
jgi:hypothetical protein